MVDRLRPLAAWALIGAAGCMDLGSRPWIVGADTPSAGSPPVDVAGATFATDAAGMAPGGADAGAPPVAPDAAIEPASPCPHPGGAAAELAVELAANTFRPSDLTICTGDAVTWTNFDTKEHTIYTGRPGAPDGVIRSPKLYFGEAYRWVFDAPGDFEYYCSTHKKKMWGAWVRVR